MGKHRIIENCTVTNARCVGISLGQAPGVDYADIDAFGTHIVRTNVIRRCGEAESPARRGATRCLVAGNLIEETNYRKEFGGWETAAIKFHESVDTVIRGNLDPRRLLPEVWGVRHLDGLGNPGNLISGQHHLRYASRQCVSRNEPRTDPGRQQRAPRPRRPEQFRKAACCAQSAGRLRSNGPSDTGRSSQYYQPHTRIVVALCTWRPGRRQVVQQHLRSPGPGGRQAGSATCVGLQCLPEGAEKASP